MIPSLGPSGKRVMRRLPGFLETQVAWPRHGLSL